MADENTKGERDGGITYGKGRGRCRTRKKDELHVADLEGDVGWWCMDILGAGDRVFADEEGQFDLT